MNGPDQISLGELSYSITGDTDPLERKLAELERERTLRLSFDLDDAAIASLNAKLQEAIKPIPITLDTTAAEAQLSAMFSSAGGTVGGNVALNNLTSNLGMLSLPAYELQGMGYPRLAPLMPIGAAAGIGAMAAEEMAGPPSIAALEQASAQANVAEMTRAMQENAYANLAGGGDEAEGMMGASGASNAGRGMRRMAGFYVAMRGGEALARRIQEDNDIEDIMHRSGDAEDNARSMIADLRERGSGMTGLGRSIISGTLEFAQNHPFAAGAFQVFSPGFTSIDPSDYDDKQQIRDLQDSIKKAKEAERRELEDNRKRERLDNLVDRGENFDEELGDEYKSTIDKGGLTSALAKIDDALNKKIREIEEIARNMERSGDPRGHDKAEQFRDRSLMLAKTTAGEQKRRLTDEDNFDLEIERRTDDALEAAINGHTLDSQLQKLYVASSRQADKLNPSDDNFNARMQEIVRRENLGAEGAFQTAYDRYSRGHLATEDRIAGIDAETAAVNRGSSMGGLVKQISDIFTDASREAREAREHNHPETAADVSKLAISQLNLLQAQLSKTHGEAADPNFTYLGRGGSENDEIPTLLRQISTDIQNLQINLRITP